MGGAAGKLSDENLESVFRQIKWKYKVISQQQELLLSVEVKNLVEKYEAASNKYECYKNGEGQLEEVLTAIKELTDKYENFAYHESIRDIQNGDVVQVKDKDIGIYVQAIVIQVDKETADVQFSSNDDEEPEYETGVPFSQMRKVQSWEYLEVGDQVKVREGSLFFEGTVQKLNLDGSVDINFSISDETGRKTEEEDEEKDYEEEDVVETHRRENITKIHSARLPKQHWKIARRVLTQVNTLQAFKLTTDDKE